MAEPINPFRCQVVGSATRVHLCQSDLDGRAPLHPPILNPVTRTDLPGPMLSMRHSIWSASRTMATQLSLHGHTSGELN